MWRTVVAFLMLMSQGSLAAQDPDMQRVAGELEPKVEELRATGSVRIGDRVVTRSSLTLDVYEQRDFLPLWSDRRAAGALLQAIVAIRQHGLDPEAYHLSALAMGDGREPGAARIAELDLLRTDAFVRMSRHLRFGKVKPDGPSGRTDSPWRFGGEDALEHVLDVVGSGRVQQALAELPPHHFVYEGLMAALADLRRIEAAGGWKTVPDGPTLALGSVDRRVPMLRRRLGTDDDLGGSSPHSGPALRFDTDLESAVRSFQHRHGLNEDGVVGRATLAALNVPVARRIEQVRISLERARWFAQELPDTFVAVNVAGAKAYLLRGDSTVFETRAIVGKNHTQTPVFTAPMTYIDLNPTWTVPWSSVGEVLDAVRSDPRYLDRQGFEILDGSGRALDPSEVDFARYTASSFPYVFRQEPGPTNPMGKIKLMFPNEHSVYLHDTPRRGLFAEEERLFSHGCIRIQEPLELAERVIGDPQTWNRETLRAAIETGETRTVRLATPMPVFVLYWTASVDLHGELHFYRDVYDRDAAILEALDANEAHDGTPSEGSR